MALILGMTTTPSTGIVWADDDETAPRLDGGGIGFPIADEASESTSSDSADDAATETSGTASTNAMRLPELTVQSTRTDLKEALSPGSVSVVYPDDVKGEHKSLPDLLDQIPGVYVRRVSGTGQYTTASIRGSAPSQVNIYIDGIPFNLASETAADLSTIPISNVERVEVYRGTTPARFSGAPVGGAINIVTKKPDGLHGGVSAGVRSYVGRQGGTNMSAPLGDGALLLGVNHEQSKGNFKYKNFVASSLPTATYSNGTAVDTATRDIPVERTRQSNDFKKDDMLVKWQNDNFFAKWAYTYMDRSLPERTHAGNPTYASNMGDLDSYSVGGVSYSRYRRISRQKQGQHDLVLGWNDTFGPLTLGANVSALDKNQRFLSLNNTSNGIGRDWSHLQTRRYGAAGDATYALGDGWAIDQMLELHGDYYRETFHADMSDNTPDSDFIGRFRRYKTDIQAQDTFTFNVLDGLQITPIGRLERLQSPVIEGLWDQSTDGNFGWQPSGAITLKKKIGQGWQAFGSYGVYNRYPSFYEIYGDGIYVVPNADSTGNSAANLKREFSHNSDVGMGWDGHIAGDVSGGFRATYFERKTKNEITLYSTPIAAKYMNSGNTYTHGGEFEGYAAWGTRADIQFAVTRQEGWYQNDGYYYYGGTSVGTRYPGQKHRTLNHPDLTADVRLNLHFLDGDLTTFLELKHTGRNFINQDSFERSLSTIDAGLHYDLGFGAKLSLGVTDLFNQGPKQSLYSPSGSSTAATGYDCSGLSGIQLMMCQLSGAFGTATYSTVPFTYNVFMPRQGRTLYSTLAWSF